MAQTCKRTETLQKPPNGQPINQSARLRPRLGPEVEVEVCVIARVGLAAR